MTGKLEDLKKLADGATPGPWAWRNFGNPCLVADHGSRDIILVDAKTIGHDRTLIVASGDTTNMQFIAACRDMVPKLIAVVEAAKAVVMAENKFTEFMQAATMADYKPGFCDSVWNDLEQAMELLRGELKKLEGEG